MFEKMNIMKLFFEEPSREFNVREVARILKISPATASKKLESLVNDRILKERKERMLNLYIANIDSDYYRDVKVFYNITKLRNSGILEALDKFYMKPTILFFGSGSYGMDMETSDFDLVVISEKTTEFEERKKFEKKLNRRLQIFAVKDIKEMKNKHLINNVLNGITIQGAVKWT